MLQMIVDHFSRKWKVCVLTMQAPAAASDQYSLVPGSGVTTLLLNDTHQRYASQFAYLAHELHTLPFNAVIYRISPDSVAGASDDRTRKFNLRMTLGAVRRKRFITPKLRK